MQKQQEVLTIQNAKAAQALNETQLMGLFLEPCSPSEAAKIVGMAANLMHHHVNRFLDMGLLFEKNRENGKVFYQLVAKNFKVPRDFLAVNELLNNQLQNLSTKFIQAFERSDRMASNSPEYLMFGFAIPEPEVAPTEENVEARPAHYELRSLNLSAESYKTLLKQISDLIEAAQAENVQDTKQCTIALMAFEGSVDDVPSESHHVHSYVF